MKRLIVNTDDFGLHPNINEAVFRGHTEGCVTSASLMASGSAFEEAVEMSRRAPKLGIGAHLTLVGAYPVLSPERVRTLVDENGKFSNQYGTFIKKYYTGKIDLHEVRDELHAQVAQIAHTRLRITHLDSHQHLHVLPGITEIAIDLAKEFNIRAMRFPGEAYAFTGGYHAEIGRFVGKCGLTFLARRAKEKTVRSNLLTPDCFFGMLAGGNMSACYITKILDVLPDGVSEIMLHPGTGAEQLQTAFGWGYHWDRELEAVMDNEVLCKIRTENIKLISFGELSNE